VPRVTQGGFWIGGAALVAALGSLVAQVLFERSLGVSGFALWAFLNSVLSIAVPAACLGSNHLILSEYYKGRLENREGFITLLKYFGGFAVPSLAAFLAAVAIAAPPGAKDLSFVVLALLFATQLPLLLVFPVFQARQQIAWVATWPVAQVGVRLAIAILALVAAWTVDTVVLAWTLASCLLVAVAVQQTWPAMRARLKRAGAESGQDVQQVRRAGLLFGLNDLFGQLDMKLIVLLASVLMDSTATAAAGICVVALAAAQLLPYVIVQRVLLPAVHGIREDLIAEVNSVVLRLGAWVTIALAPLAVIWWWIGFPMVSAIVRGDYASQANAIGLLGLSAIPLSVSELAVARHMARERASRLLRWRVESVLVFIVASALAGRWFGLEALILAFALGRLWLCVRVLAPHRG
jgi:O-antigen/teichoic acid export membrane protein